MKLQVTIDWFQHAKIMHWVRQAKDLEVSGFGRVLKFKNHLHVSEVFLLEQKNTAASTIICDKAMGRAMYEQRNKDGDMNFWWHSHHTMSAYFSKTDYDTLKQFGSNGWLLATVFNTYEETATGLYVTQPFEFISEGFQLRVLPPMVTEGVRRGWANDYEGNVTELRRHNKNGRRTRAARSIAHTADNAGEQYMDGESMDAEGSPTPKGVVGAQIEGDFYGSKN